MKPTVSYREEDLIRDVAEATNQPEAAVRYFEEMRREMNAGAPYMKDERSFMLGYDIFNRVEAQVKEKLIGVAVISTSVRWRKAWQL